MLSNNQIKLINSLHSKKGRADNNQFLVEGEKGISELLDSDFDITMIIINKSCEFKELDIAQKKHIPIFFIEDRVLQKLSSLKTNSFGLAIVKFSTNNIYLEDKEGFTLVLDGIRDPGNLGTIIRICDWYGINQIVLSEDSTEFYNPKVISATMGSFKRIRFFYTDLPTFFKENQHLPVLGAYLDGENIHSYQFPNKGLILMGNESIGIRENNLRYVTHKLTIPRFGNAESLNVAISTGIILDNLKRF